MSDKYVCTYVYHNIELIVDNEMWRKIAKIDSSSSLNVFFVFRWTAEISGLIDAHGGDRRGR